MRAPEPPRAEQRGDRPHSSHNEAKARRARLRGIGLMCAAAVLFACLDATGKLLVRSVDPIQAVWARNFGAMLLALAMANPLGRPERLRSKRLPLQLIRSGLLVASTMLNFAALRFLPLDRYTAIQFSGAFFIAIMAGPILGEWIGPRRWAAIVVGFLGVLVVTHPGIGGIEYAALLPMTAAISYALYSISTRVLARVDPSETTLIYSNLVGTTVLSLLLPAVWRTPADAATALLMVVVGLFGGLGHYLLILAHRVTPASILAPFMYSQLLWASLFGAALFGDLPSAWTLSGAAIIIASGLYLLHRERVRGRR